MWAEEFTRLPSPWFVPERWAGADARGRMRSLTTTPRKPDLCCSTPPRARRISLLPAKFSMAAAPPLPVGWACRGTLGGKYPWARSASDTSSMTARPRSRPTPATSASASTCGPRPVRQAFTRRTAALPQRSGNWQRRSGHARRNAPGAGRGQPHLDSVEDLVSMVRDLGTAGATFRVDIVAGQDGKQILLEDRARNPIEPFRPAQRE